MTDSLAGDSMYPHPAAEQIASYLSGTLAAPQRADLEAHLAECRGCRQEVLSSQRLLRSHVINSRQRRVIPFLGAAALVAILLARWASAPRVPEENVRGIDDAPTLSSPALRALEPADRATIPRGHVVFVWSGQAPGTIYRLTVTSEAGEAVWLRETSDSSLTLPAGISLQPGRTYFWYVDALDTAGQSITSGTRRFTAE
jgi:hypothetical protein